MEKVILETEKEKFLNIDYSKAIEISVNEFFNGRNTKINGKNFDIMNYGNYKEKLVMEN